MHGIALQAAPAPVRAAMYRAEIDAVGLYSKYSDQNTVPPAPNVQPVPPHSNPAQASPNASSRATPRRPLAFPVQSTAIATGEPRAGCDSSVAHSAGLGWQLAHAHTFLLPATTHECGTHGGGSPSKAAGAPEPFEALSL